MGVSSSCSRWFLGISLDDFVSYGACGGGDDDFPFLAGVVPVHLFDLFKTCQYD